MSVLHFDTAHLPTPSSIDMSTSLINEPDSLAGLCALGIAESDRAITTIKPDPVGQANIDELLERFECGLLSQEESIDLAVKCYANQTIDHAQLSTIQEDIGQLPLLLSSLTNVTKSSVELSQRFRHD